LREARAGLEEVRGAKEGAALFALVAISFGVAAVRAGAYDVAVREEGFDHGVVELLHLASLQVATF
jgi:hypothetical protein